MGSMIHLAIGGYQIDWGKNDQFMRHGSLFQHDDLAQIAYEYVGDNGEVIQEMKEGAVRPLSEVVGRLELMGYTLGTAKKSFESLASEEISSTPVSFEIVAEALRRVRIDDVIVIKRKDHSFQKLFAKIFNRLQLRPTNSAVVAQHDFGKRLYRAMPQGEADIFILANAVQILSPYVVLRLLAENPDTATRDVSWAFADVVENGWVHRERIVGDLGQVRKFLVVTEGSSDSKVIEHALNVLRPDIADFFHFVDMEKGYPFTGVGNLHRFCQGLVSIGIENNVVVIYDNDAIGAAGHEKTSKLPLPPNMRVLRLPDCESLRQFDTIGPNGNVKANINGSAAAIECYLDLHWKRVEHPVVRWTSYEKTTGSYQGELLRKKFYAQQFLGLKRQDPEYDYSKIETVLESLISASIKIAEEMSCGQDAP